LYVVADEQLLNAGLVAGAWPRDHGFAVETGELDRAVWEGSTRGDQDVGIVEQLEVFDVAGNAAVVEHQVHLVDRWRIGFILDQADVASRLLVAQPADNVGQEHVGNALEGADIDASLAARNTDGIWFDSRTWLVTAQRQ